MVRCQKIGTTIALWNEDTDTIIDDWLCDWQKKHPNCEIVSLQFMPCGAAKDIYLFVFFRLREENAA